MSAIMTVAGLYSYRTDLFDNLVLPVAPTAAEMGVENDQIRQTWSINKNDFIDFLCLQTMGMCVAIPDADFLKSAIGTWSKAHLYEWQLAFETLFYKFNPLWNKDGKVTETEDVEHSKETSDDLANSVTSSDTTTGYTHGYNGGTTHTDDGLAWDHANKQKGSGSSSSTGSRDGTESGTESRERTLYERGNIGVTTSQSMIQEQRELVKFNIEELIVDSFKNQFLLMLW